MSQMTGIFRIHQRFDGLKTLDCLGIRLHLNSGLVLTTVRFSIRHLMAGTLVHAGCFLEENNLATTIFSKDIKVSNWNQE